MEERGSMGKNAEQMNNDYLGRSCPFCYKIFFDKFSCKRHVKNIHKEVNVELEVEKSPEKKLLKCKLCGRKFQYSWNLNVHMEHHDKDLQKKL